MKILAIDSSGLVASVAIIVDERMVAEYTVDYKKTHSQTLLPMLDEIVKMVDFNIDELDAIAVAAGPGSFTGLRIGSSTAKGLAFALHKPIISVPTVDGLAYNLFGTSKLICPIMDAKRNQVYTGLYQFTNQGFQIISNQKAVSIDDIIEEIIVLDREVIFLGDGVEVYRDGIIDKLGNRCMFAPPHLSKQRAGSIGALAVNLYETGQAMDSAEHQPIYLRLSQAERELAIKNKEGGVVGKQV